MAQHPFEQVPLADLRERTSIKWRFFEPDVLPMWVAEMDVLPAEAITEAVHAAMLRGDTGYPHGTGYAEAFGRFADDRWSATVDVARTALVSDVMMGAFELIRLLTPPGGSVIVTSPVYPPFHAYSTHAELESLAAIADRHGVRVVSDEVHAPLLFDATFTPYWTVDPRGFSLTSASKAWNLAGLRTALIVGGTATADDLAGLSTGPAKAFLEQARVGLSAGEAFGTGGENHVRFNLGTRADVIEDAVRRMGAVA